MLLLTIYNYSPFTQSIYSTLFCDYPTEICDNYQCNINYINNKRLYLDFFKQLSMRNKISYWRILQVLEKLAKELS